MVREVKPEPDLFLLCQQKLKVERSDCLIVGDAVWDIHAARRSGILSVGLLSGGFGEQELYNAGAMRVYRDTRALHEGIDELGFEQRSSHRIRPRLTVATARSLPPETETRNK